jgi:hypothetical protein
MRLLTGHSLASYSACNNERGCLTDSIVGGDTYGKTKPASSLPGNGEAGLISTTQNLRGGD